MSKAESLRRPQLLALTKYDETAASTRQRFLQYRQALTAAGIDLQISPLFGSKHMASLVNGQRVDPAATALAYARRLATLLSSSPDAYWVHCELYPYLPAVLERLVFLRRKPVIYDYDDAIFHMYDGTDRRSIAGRWLEGKLGPLIAGAGEVIAGNPYLADYARQWNDAVTVIPTVVDTDAYKPATGGRQGPPVIGWIGSPSTWSYVRPFLPLLEGVCRDQGARFLAVGAGLGARVDHFDGMELRDWSEAREIADVQSMDIGIMPAPNDPWARGKSGYKLIQYMACGLPTVASPVGVNREIVLPGKTGYLAANEKEWRVAFARLLGDHSLRQAMGEAGRERAKAGYSLAVQAPRIVEVMQRAVR